MENTLEQEWYQYFTQLNDEERKSVLQMLKTFIKGRNATSERTTIEQYNKELEESERQIEEGNYTTQEDLEKEMEQW